MNKEQKARVAVVGSGVSGLSSAYTLALQGFSVTLFEKRDRLGGHTFTYKDENDGVEVDLGFQVFNLTNYPYMTEFLKELKVESEQSDMSFSFSVDGGRFEWASNKHKLNSLFAQKENILNKEFRTMLSEAIRFGKVAEEVLTDEKLGEMSLGEYLDLRKFSECFREFYLLPMTAAVWSVPCNQMLDFPVKTFVAFWKNHHLLNPIGSRPTWRVCKNRSQEYLKKIIHYLEQNPNCSVKVGTGVENLRQTEEKKLILTSSDGEEFEFDQIIFACHSNQALDILRKEESFGLEAELLGKIKYQKNEVYLHSDENLMPKLKKVWSSWNVLDEKDDSSGKRNICVTYWLNHLQNLPQETNLKLCSLNPISPIDPKKIIYKTVLEHPVFDREMLKARDEINNIQSTSTISSRNVWFCGAYLGNGFHEDGIASAVRICSSLTGRKPTWIKSLDLKSPSPVLKFKDKFFYKIFKQVFRKGVDVGCMKIVLPNGKEDVFGRKSIEIANERGEPTATLYIKDLSVIYNFLKDSDVGLGEGFMYGLFDISFTNENDDLLNLFKILILNAKKISKVVRPNSNFNSVAQIAAKLLFTAGNQVLKVLHHLNRNTIAGSKRNIEAHYDLGNDMYQLFLDKTMTYSAGIYDSPNCSLYQSQLNKLDRIISKLNLNEDDEVLEIGCGWGSFAIRAAETVGCKVYGITISIEQLEFANERIKERGLEDKVFLFLCDYRKLGNESSSVKRFRKKESFDKVVSIEMIEAVGHENLPEYFEVINRMLKNNNKSKALIQAISLDDDRYEHYRKSSDFIRRHIFPGGHLVSLEAVKWGCEETNLILDEAFEFGKDYAKTLSDWKQNFYNEKDKILKQGFPKEFIRKWMFYFSYCEAGFELGYIRDYHLLLTKSVEQKELSESKMELPLISTMLPATFWFFSWLFNSPALKLTSSIAILSVLVTSSLVSMFGENYFNPPKHLVSTKRKEWVTAMYDSHFALSVLVTVPLSFFLTLQFTPFANLVDDENDERDFGIGLNSWIVLRVLLFSSFGKLAAANARDLASSLPYFLNSLFLVMVTSFCFNPKTSFVAMTFILLHGIEELFEFFSSMKTIKGLDVQDEAYNKLKLLELISGTICSTLPLILFLSFNLSFLMEHVVFTISISPVVYKDLKRSFHLISQKLLEKDEIQLPQVESDLKVTGICEGFISHSRSSKAGRSLTSKNHSFKYKIWMALVDLDEVRSGSAFKSNWLISCDKPNFFSFNQKDFYKSHPDLKSSIQSLVKKNLNLTVDGPVRVLTNLRCFGYIFNSLSIFYCYNKNEDLIAIVLEVSNTPWLCKRQYVLKNEGVGTKFYSRFKKDFHVSPFLDVFYDYEWDFEIPDFKKGIIKASSKSIRRKETKGEGDEWHQVVGDSPVELNLAGDDGKIDMRVFFNFVKSENDLKSMMKFPFMTFLASFYIHLEAYFVFKKGGKYQKTPKNQRKVGLKDLAANFLIFLVAAISICFTKVFSCFKWKKSARN